MIDFKKFMMLKEAGFPQQQQQQPQQQPQPQPQQQQPQQQVQQQQPQQQQPQNANNLDQAKNAFMKAFQQQFAKDPQGSLSWLNSFFSKGLPADYKAYYAQWQKTQQKQPQGQQQPQQK